MHAKIERRKNPPVAVAAAISVTVGIVAACFSYAFDLRGLLANRFRTMQEVTALKAAAINDWRLERLSDVEDYASDPDHIRRSRLLAAGDVPVRRLFAADFENHVRRGTIVSARILSNNGRVLLAVGDAEKPGPSELDLSRPMGVGTLVFRFRLNENIQRGIRFWPQDLRTTRTRLVRAADGAPVVPTGAAGSLDPLTRAAVTGPQARIESRDERGVLGVAVSRPLEGTDWTLISQSDREELAAEARTGALLTLGWAASGCMLLLILFDRRALAREDEVREKGESTRAVLVQAVEQAAESIVITDAAGRIEYVNPAFTAVSGYSRAEVIGVNPRILKSGLQGKSFYEELWSTLKRNETWRGRLSNRRKDGTLYEEDATITPVRDKDGAILHYIAVKRDIGVERSLEDQLRHSQKMEAVGRLAGGIAHDFNNILTSILGYAEIASGSVAPDSALAQDLAEITRSGKLAAELTRRLLTFSRKQISAPVTLDLNAALAGIEKMLRRTVSEDVRLSLELSPRPLWIKMDASQMDQIVLNLTVNACDAMPDGGRLRLVTTEVELTKPFGYSYWSVPPGRYARLCVIDTGTGISLANQERIFEPFFTTKENGKGTGLGLATVFGIVQQAKGYIVVNSEPGKGASFLIYLPLAEAPAANGSAPSAKGAVRAGPREKVLLVEDQESLRRLTERVLRGAGYEVLSFPGPAETLSAGGAVLSDASLLLTDVVMPVMGGREMAETLRARRPDLRVMYMSGYTDEKVARGGVLEPGVDLLPKPFTPEQLLARVRSAIGS